MALLPVHEALNRIVAHVRPKDIENVLLNDAQGRVLAQDLTAKRTHPPFDSSAMDGYAVRFEDAYEIGQKLHQIGESAAGHGFSGKISSGETVRIFTGAPVPEGADTILIQENAKPLDDQLIEVSQGAAQGRHIRKKGLDFQTGDQLLSKGRVMSAIDITLAASMNYSEIPVYKKPLVGVLATGDELVSPGGSLGPDQIIASNSYGVAAIAKQHGADILDLGIAKDNLEDINASIQRAKSSNVDILVTIGGASVGDHDLVHKALTLSGMESNFWRIAMRPGKPLMSGQIDNMQVLGLPGNPASSLVTSLLFLVPLIHKFLGQVPKHVTQEATSKNLLPKNDHRQEYMRAHISFENGQIFAQTLNNQDSSLMRVFAEANGFIIRPPHADETQIGEPCDIMMIN